MATLAGARQAKGRSRVALRERLEARLVDVEEATLARVTAISDPAEVSDPTYIDGLHRAIAAALEFALDAIERGPRHEAPVPVALLAQARLAARNGVSLDAVLRRYFAGYALIGEFLIEEAEALGLPPEELSEILSANAGLFDRLIAAIGAEHAREAQNRPDTSARRRLEQVRRLLGGERADSGELAYELNCHHLGVVAEGPGAEGLLRSLAQELDRRLLFVAPEERTVWAWLGGRYPLDTAQAAREMSSAKGEGCVMALGEPAEGLAGWRLTHRQAAAALPVALRDPGRVVRYAGVALLAAALRDDLLATSLRRLYLAPLEHTREGETVARETLRAYFAAERNVSAASASLGVSRPTVTARLRAIEEKIGMPMHLCAAEVETALRLAQRRNP